MFQGLLAKKSCLITVKHYSIKILRFNPIALQKAKTVLKFWSSECKRLNDNVIQADSHKENFDNNLSLFLNFLSKIKLCHLLESPQGGHSYGMQECLF